MSIRVKSVFHPPGAFQAGLEAIWGAERRRKVMIFYLFFASTVHVPCYFYLQIVPAKTNCKVF